MTVTRSAGYRRARSRVLGWARWYTRGLDPRIAGERLDQLASDLHDQAVWAESAGLSASRTARAITARSFSGVLDDLSWRRDQMRRRPVSLDARATSRGNAVLLAVAAMGVAMISVGSASLVGATESYLRHHDEAISIPLVLLAVSLVFATGGMVLLTLPRARVVGAFSLAVAAIPVIQFSFATLLYSSSAVNQAMYLNDLWPLPKYVLIGSLMLYFAAAAIWWYPTRDGSMPDKEVR